ncbi:hypothetical protein SCHPADRAFT_947570 [Schizopora paradoxa]|uniref:Uncharacterized protein n=1 Tax=Schizopora paradoxa TaxID=27342 RepID=A0A0H2QYH9_9AGAM|nr:hypothetical protein SCHPADRAFT_947570 [Schizopora paradoxa]
MARRSWKKNKLGEGSSTGSWIWGKGPQGILSDAEEDKWEEEVKWFWARLDLKQWREEVEMLDEELKHTGA